MKAVTADVVRAAEISVEAEALKTVEVCALCYKQLKCQLKHKGCKLLKCQDNYKMYDKAALIRYRDVMS